MQVLYILTLLGLEILLFFYTVALNAPANLVFMRSLKDDTSIPKYLIFDTCWVVLLLTTSLHLRDSLAITRFFVLDVKVPMLTSTAPFTNACSSHCNPSSLSARRTASSS